MKKRILAATLLVIALVFTSCIKTTPSNSTASANPKLDDLEFFCEQLERKHKNLYAKITRESFLAEKQIIADNIDTLSDSDFYYSLKHLLSLVGDAHTSLGYNDSNYKHLGALGFAVAKFSDGWHLLMLEEQNKAYLGYKLVAISNVDIEDVFEKAKTIMSFDNEAWAEQQFSNIINFREALEYLKIAEKGGSITLQIKKNDSSAVEALEIKSMNEAEIMSANIISLKPKKAVVTLPQGLYRSMQLDNTTYYIQYNSCQEAPELSMAKFAEEVSAEISANAYKKVIIDMRYNSGGNSAVLNPLTKELKALQKKLNFEVYTLIGGNTFSSAIINSIDMKNELNSKLVGSQTGGSVNGYGELKSFTLPNSPIIVMYSTKYFELVKGYDKASLYPDIEIEQSFENYLNGIDAEVAAVLSL